MKSRTYNFFFLRYISSLLCMALESIKVFITDIARIEERRFGERISAGMIYERYNLFARVVLAPSYVLLSRYKSIEKYTGVKRECDHRARFTAAESSPNGTLIQHQYEGRTPLFLQGSSSRPRRAQRYNCFATFCSAFIGGLNC